MQPIDEIAEFDEQKIKIQAPDNMHDKILNNKIVSLNDKDLLSKDEEKDNRQPSKRYSTKEVFNFKSALNTKK